MEHQLVTLILTVMATVPTTVQASNDMATEQLTIKVAVQSLCNLIANNEQVAWQLWHTYLTKDSDALRSIVYTDDASTRMVFLVFLVNSCKFSSRISRLLIQDVTWLLGDILSWADHLHKNEQNEDFELLHTLIITFMEHNLLSPLVQTLYSPHNRTRWLSSPLAIALKFIDAHLNTHTDYLFESENMNAIHELYQDIALQSIKLLRSSSSAINDTDTTASSSSSSSSSSLTMPFDDHCACLLLLLQILIHQSLVQPILIGQLEGLIPRTIELLGASEQAIPRATPVSNSSADKATSASSQIDFDGFNCVKRDTVRLLGNVAYQQVTIQDQIRELGGLALILGQCSMDDRNPFIREYAIMAVRCLLEDNMANQELVAQLTPVAASQHPALAEAGFKVALDENGKPQLQKLERQNE
ncbi:spinocerebellar ataxia type 10 protein domain-containing protein [Syncephalis plumigaleata]|nr:spinocerebellar ataxia type 10 protein domain-containing protein [Syncephalis plumigaleata]